MIEVRGAPEMHPALREGWDFVEEVRGRLLRAIQPLSAGQWSFCPAGGWCIAQVIDHLLRAEIGTSKMVRK